MPGEPPKTWQRHDRTVDGDAGLLDATTVVDYLAGRGLVLPGSAVVEVLGGGVSNVVLAVADSRHRLVVKQALPRLRVAEEWTAPTGRALTEADALELAAAVTPDVVPAVVDRDADRHVLVLDHAPAGWRDWKILLLGGAGDERVATQLGEALAAWHTATQDLHRLPERIRRGADAFERLRVDPFYRTVAHRAPDLADDVLATADAMQDRRMCLVHGDFSPKNVLVDPAGGGLWVIDFEVAHAGDPAFDLAFLLCHLTLKALHRPVSAVAYDRCSAAFATSYERRVDTALTPDWRYVMRHVGCLVLARVRGKSPAEYLADKEQDAAWRLGVALLAAPPDNIRGLAAVRDEVSR